MNRWAALALLVMVNALWGASYLFVKIALADQPPVLIGAMRFTLAAALLWLVQLGVRLRRGSGPPPPRLTRPDALRLGALGLVAIALNHLLGNWGVSLTTVTDASLMIVGEVIFTSLLAALIAGERPGRWRGLGVLVGIAGVTLLILGSAGDGSRAQAWARALGDLLILAGLLGEAAYTVLGSGLARRYPPLTVLTAVTTGSLIVWLPVLAWHLATGRFPPLSPAAAGSVLYLGAVSSGICYLVWFTVLARAGANLGAVSLFVQPLVGSLLGLTIMGDTLTTGLLTGGPLILLALYLAALPDRRPAVAAHTPPQTPLSRS